MVKKMRFGVLTKAKNAEIHERPLPVLGEKDILIKQEACNICTTDYGQWQGLREHQPYPMAGGHEGSGIIVSKGSKVRDDLQIGDRVALAYYYCGECEACMSGKTGNCQNYSIPLSDDGYYGFFGFADYCVKDSRYAIKMDKDLPPAEAGFLEPLATVINGIKRLDIGPMDNVVIIGAGTMGLVNAQAIRRYGARVIITELFENKIKKAKELNFEDVVDASKVDPVDAVMELTGGKGADIVILAVGATQANAQALKMLKKFDGKVLFFAAGYPAPKLEVDSNLIHYRKCELIGTFGADIQDFYDSAKLLNNGLVNMKPLLEESFPLDEIQKAFEVASVPENYRVTVVL